MNSPSIDDKEPTSETPFIRFCEHGHTDSEGKPLPFQILGYRIAHKKVNGIWTDYEEPIYECIKCVFPDGFE